MRLLVHFLTNCMAFLTLSIYRCVSVVTQSGRLYSGGGAACLPLTVSDILWPILPGVRSCSAPLSDPRESCRQETVHTIAQRLFDERNNSSNQNLF